MTQKIKQTLNRPCPLCGSIKALLHGDLAFAVFDGSPISGGCVLVSCTECGFAFYDTPSRQPDFDRYYEENAYYYTTTSTGSGGGKPDDIKRFEGVVKRLMPYLERKDAAIFDVGCAKGGLLSILSKCGFSRLYGVDMLQDCIRHVSGTLGFSAEIGSALDIPFQEVAADVLIYSHIVEHVIDLKALATKAMEKLNDNGILYVEVPDASRYGECSSYPYQDFYLEHVNHFDMVTLSCFFKYNGFVVLASGKYELATASHGFVPCIWVILGKGKPVQEITCCPGLGNSLQRYLEQSARHPLLERLTKLVKNNSPLYVWGISQYAMLLLGQTALKDGNIKGFIDKDSFKQKRTLMGRLISSPGVLQKATSDDTVFVAALGFEDEIASNLKDMGFNGTILTSESS